MKRTITICLLILLCGKILSDELSNPYMNQEDFLVFIDQVSNAVSLHPEYLSSLDSLRAAGANLDGTKSNLLPQIRLIIDSNNQLDKSFEEGSNNLFEKSRSGSISIAVWKNLGPIFNKIFIIKFFLLKIYLSTC